MIGRYCPLRFGFRGGGGIKYDFPNQGTSLEANASDDIQLDGESAAILRSNGAVIGAQVTGGIAGTGKVSLVTSTGTIQLTATQSDIVLAASAGGNVIIKGNETISFNVAEDVSIQRFGPDILFLPNRVRFGKETDFVEIADPGAPGANHAFLFARDVAGKTQLCARFPTGAIQAIVTEP